MQKLLPQQGLSRLIGKLAEWKNHTKLKNWIIKQYIDYYGVNMEEALQSDYTQYANFNDFFTRHLKPDVRPIDKTESSIVSPVDGIISEFGDIRNDQLLQAKDVYYPLDQLIVDRDYAREFQNGKFFTAYLAPGDYHRIHMPCDARLLKMIHVPGKLFSVNPYTVSNITKLFCMNERVISIFATENGFMIMIAVGAIIVGGIATTWHGVVTPPTQTMPQYWNYQNQEITFQKGEEMGHFRLGSTVILLFQNKRVHWQDSLMTKEKVKVGQIVGKVQDNMSK